MTRVYSRGKFLLKSPTKEAGVIYRSKLGLARTSPKFWGMVDTYMESLYTKYQVNQSTFVTPASLVFSFDGTSICHFVWLKHKVETKEELVSMVERLWRSPVATESVDWSSLESRDLIQ